MQKRELLSGEYIDNIGKNHTSLQTKQKYHL